MADGVAIDTTATTSFTVTSAEIGKKISVKVTGDNGSEAVSAETAAVEAPADADLEITAEQTGAAQVTIKANKAVALTDALVIKRGTTTVSSTFVTDEAGTTITVTTGTKLSSGVEYEVTITPADASQKAATTTFTGKENKLESIDFVGENLVLTSSDYLTCGVKIFGYDTFGDKVALSSLNPYASKGTATYSAADNEITLTLVNPNMFTAGEQIVVTAMYQDGAVVKQVSKTLTVSNMASVSKLEFGELKSTNTALANAPVNISNMSGGTYYKEVVAEDQYGNVLTANDLKKMLFNSTTNSKGTLYATPSQATGSYVYLDSFDTTADNKVIAKYKLGALGMPGKQIFTYTAVGGYTTTDEIEVVDDPFIASLTVQVPELYGGKEAELTLIAKDQDGNDVDLFNFVGTTNKVKTGADGTGTFGGAAQYTYTFDDINHLTQGASSITIPQGLTLKVGKNTANKTVKFTLTPASNTDAQSKAYVLTVQTATPTVANVQCSVQTDPHPYGIATNYKGKTTNSVTVKASTAYDLTKNVMLLDQYSADLDTVAALVTATKVGLETTTKIVATDDFATAGYAVQFLKSDGTILTTPAAVTTAGTYTAELWYDEDGATTTKHAVRLANKTFTIVHADTTYVSYSAGLSSDDKLLYVGAANQDCEKVVVKGRDASGNEVTLDYGEYTTQLRTNPTGGLTITSGVVEEGTGVAWDAAAGEAKGTAIVDVYVSGEVVASVDVPYSNKDPVTSAMTATLNGKSVDVVSSGIEVASANSGSYTLTTVATDGTPTDDVLYVDKDGTGIAVTKDTADYVIKFVDQYGRSVISAKWQGVDIVNGQSAVFARRGTLVVLNGNFSQAIPVSIEDSSSAATAITVTNEAALVAAVNAGDRDVTLDADVTLTQPITVAAGKKLTIASTRTLVNESTITVEGALEGSNNTDKLTNNGTIVFGAAGTFGATTFPATVDVTASGTWTLGNTTAAAQKNILDKVAVLAPTTAMTVNINKSSAVVAGALIDAKTTVNVAEGVTLSPAGALTATGKLNNAGTIAMTDTALTVSATTGELTNTGTITFTSNANSKLVNNGTVNDSGTITLGALATVEQGGTATFSGGTKTTVAASKFLLKKDGATTFTEAPSGANFVMVPSDTGAGDSFTIQIGSKKGYFTTHVTGTAVTTATDIATFTEAAPASPKTQSGTITIVNGTSTITIAL